LLNSSGTELRLRAALALGKFRDEESVPALCELLHERGRLPGAAAAALGQIGDRRAVSPLCALLQRSAASEVLQEAATALGILGDVSAVPELSATLSHADPVVRFAAARGLGHFEDPAAIAALCRTLEDRETTVRQAAAMALGEVAQRASAPLPLRAAVPSLRRLCSPRNADWAPAREIYRKALQQIEAATGSLKGLPLPAEATSHAPDTLPLPSHPLRVNSPDETEGER
jgi:HEAT repeat protein